MIKYLSIDESIEVHNSLVATYGGLQGIREHNLLESALAMPMTAMFNKDMYPSIFDKAACYLFFIATNHPFVDGNKRTATSCCLLFLQFNDIKLSYKEDELIEFVVDIAQGKIDKVEISKYLRSICLDPEKKLQ